MFGSLEPFSLFHGFLDLLNMYSFCLLADFHSDSDPTERQEREVDFSDVRSAARPARPARTSDGDEGRKNHQRFPRRYFELIFFFVSSTPLPFSKKFLSSLSIQFLSLIFVSYLIFFAYYIITKDLMKMDKMVDSDATIGIASSINPMIGEEDLDVLLRKEMKMTRVQVLIVNTIPGEHLMELMKEMLTSATSEDHEIFRVSQLGTCLHHRMIRTAVMMLLLVILISLIYENHVKSFVQVLMRLLLPRQMCVFIPVFLPPSLPLSFSLTLCVCVIVCLFLIKFAYSPVLDSDVYIIRIYIYINIFLL